MYTIDTTENNTKRRAINMCMVDIAYSIHNILSQTVYAIINNKLLI